MGSRALHRVTGVIAVIAFSVPAVIAFRLFRADWSYRQATPASVDQAIALNPFNAEYFLGLAQVAPERAEWAYGRAVQLDPRDALTRILLSFEAEERGDDPEAEKELLSALNSDHTYKSRWALANFYFRHNQEDRFWNAAKEALEWAPRDTDAIFDLCWRLNPDPAFIAGRVLNSRPTVLRDYLNFLQMHKMAAQAYPVASRLLALNDVSDAPRLISYINSAIPTDDWAHGVQIWNQLSQKGWISLPALSLDSPQISNGDFRVPITGVGFDWRKGSCPGVYYEQDTAASRLVVEFSGDQPERCLILEQFVPTLNGVSALRAEASPTLDANSGLSWVLSDLDGRGIQPSKEQSVLRLARIALVYAKGTPRTRGRFVIQNVRLARSYGMLDAVHSANGEIVDSDSARGGPQTPN